MATQNARSRLLVGSSMVGWRSRRRRTVFPEPILHARNRVSPTIDNVPVTSALAVEDLVDSALHQNQTLDAANFDDLLHKITS